MTWFTEDPTPILIAGGIALAVLLVLLLKTGRGIVLVAMGGVIVLMVLALLIDKFVVTDRERVANVIYQAAAAAEQNKPEVVLSFISPSAPGVKAEAQHWIGRAKKLETVNISAMEVTLDDKAQPPEATAEFRLFARGEVREGQSTYPGQYLGRVWVKLRREAEGWRVISYHRDN